MDQEENIKEQLFDDSEKISNSDNDEKIIIHPSTELIPDEYDHKTNETGVVHLFYAYDKYAQQNVEEMFFTLKKCGYKISKENVHRLFSSDEGTTNIDLSELLQSIAKNVNENNSSLLLFFSANFEKNNSFIATENGKMVHYNPQKVWSFFTANNCPMLKNKPKIFIFQMSPKIKNIEIDAVPFSSKYYDTPAEADILIIFNKTNDTSAEYRIKFVSDLCNLIKSHGKVEDLLTIVSCTSQEENDRPLIISTLTRRFFVCVSEERGYRFILNEDIQSLSSISETVHNRLQNLTFNYFSTQNIKNFAFQTIKFLSPSSNENRSILDDINEDKENIFSELDENLQDNKVEVDGFNADTKEKLEDVLNRPKKNCKGKMEKTEEKTDSRTTRSLKLINKKMWYLRQETEKIKNILMITIALIVLFLGAMIIQIF